ncbi:MAG TPA: gas vesicle protein GvpJ [Pirellulales bacterium]|nr:gas vesicle protein GvpJ [Pirellulales bacterium]
MTKQQNVTHAVNSAGLADVLERILDKGLVIVGDIKVKLVDIELLTIQIRLLVASVDKAREIGIDWWTMNPQFGSRLAQSAAAEGELMEGRAPSPGET